MYCYKCGAMLPDDANFCDICGAGVQRVRDMRQPPAAPEYRADEPQVPVVQEPAVPEPPWAAPSAQSYAPPPPPPFQPFAAQAVRRTELPPGGKLRDYMPHSVIVTILSLFCCQPFSLILGIIAIVFASKSQTESRKGDLKAAYDAAGTSRILWMISAGLIILGIVLAIIWIVFTVVVGAAGSFPNFGPMRKFI